MGFYEPLYKCALKSTLFFTLLFLTGGLDPGDQICLCRADFLLYREENATLVLAVVLLRIGCIAVACIIRAPGLAVLLIVALPLTVAVSIAVIAGISVSIISTAGVVLVVPVAVTGIILPVIIGMEIIVQ